MTYSKIKQSLTEISSETELKQFAAQSSIDGSYPISSSGEFDVTIIDRDRLQNSVGRKGYTVSQLQQLCKHHGLTYKSKDTKPILVSILSANI